MPWSRRPDLPKRRLWIRLVFPSSTRDIVPSRPLRLGYLGTDAAPPPSPQLVKPCSSRLCPGWRPPKQVRDAPAVHPFRTGPCTRRTGVGSVFVRVENAPVDAVESPSRRPVSARASRSFARVLPTVASLNPEKKTIFH